MKQTARLGIALVSLFLPTACGSTADPIGTDPSGNGAKVAFLEPNIIHNMTVEFDEDEYAAAIAAYEADESKEWIHATVTIDGATYEDVGIRLKGNSSLFSLRSGGRGGPGGTADAEEPASLPWLIRLDKYVVEQNHDGTSDLVVRSNSTETALNEAVALDLLEAAGLAYQESAYASFSVNGSEPMLRLVMENPDDTWMTGQFEDSGILYKAEATGDYSYRGDDPEAYDQVFDVEAGSDDLSPLIDFLDFLNNSDDTTFYEQLDQRLDTESFATYLAFQELIANNDDIDGRGNNSYLYYDNETHQFTVVAWDHNLAFGAGGAGADIPGAGPARPNGDTVGTDDPSTSNDVAAERRQNSPGEGPGWPGGPAGPVGSTMGNVLADRFLANAEYAARYQSELERLTAELYVGGVAAEILDRWTDLTGSSELVTSTAVTDEASDIRGFFS